MSLLNFEKGKDGRFRMVEKGVKEMGCRKKKGFVIPVIEWPVRRDVSDRLRKNWLAYGFKK